MMSAGLARSKPTENPQDAIGFPVPERGGRWNASFTVGREISDVPGMAQSRRETCGITGLRALP
jgi:hypothetical protein